MAVISCDGCGGKMNSELAVCPHCGVRRQLAERPKWSNDEIHALLATDRGVRDAEPARGMFQTLVLPHPATAGGVRIIELVLTAISLPLVIAGAATIGISRRARHVTGAGGEFTPALAMTVFGAVGLASHVPLAAIGVLVAAMWTRAWVRTRAGAVRGRDLMRIEPVPRASTPALAPARVVRDEPAAAKPELAAPPAAAPAARSVTSPAASPAALPAAQAVLPKPEPPSEPGAEPRLLR
jgi:hypothetical protein